MPTDTIITITMFGLTIVYFALGIEYTTVLRLGCNKYRALTDEHTTLYAASLVAWPVLFLASTLIFFKELAVEVLTASRQNDYIDNRLDD